MQLFSHNTVSFVFIGLIGFIFYIFSHPSLPSLHHLQEATGGGQTGEGAQEASDQETP